MKTGTLLIVWMFVPLSALAQGAKVGSAPPAEAVPRVEFAFEERVTLAPAVVLGDTALGWRQYIPITGGTVAGPKLKGRVVPGGFDFQLTYTASHCTQLSADYFLAAEDGTAIQCSMRAWSARAASAACSIRSSRRRRGLMNG